MTLNHSDIRKWVNQFRVYLVFWLSTGTFVLWLVGQLSTQSLQSHRLMNFASIQATKSLFAPGGPDESQLNVARQIFYQAMDTGHDPYAVLQRLREIESSCWYLRSQILKQQGQDWERIFTYQQWTRRQFDRTILDLWQSTDLPNWSGLGKAAERMQLWSLAAHFYRHALTSDSAGGDLVRMNYGQALLQSGQPGEAEKYLSNLVLKNPADQVKAKWLLTQSFAAQARWSEAANLVQAIAIKSPDLLYTAEAAIVVRRIEEHVPVTVTANLRSAWAREASNLLANGGYEKGYMGWGMWPEPGANNTIDDQRVYSGLQSFRVQFDGSRDVNYYQVGQTVAVQPGKAYELSAQMWAEGFTGHLGVEARGGEWLGGNTTQVHGSTGGWQLVTLIFTVPENVTQIGITLRRYNGYGVVSGTVWIDDIILEPM